VVILDVEDEDLEDLDEDLEEESTEIHEKDVNSKTPAEKIEPRGKKISVYFMSTIGPGEKKQKLLLNTKNLVGDIKETVANLFGLNSDDFHLSSGGITMDEDTPLKEYNVVDGDDVLLIPASIAGKCIC